MSHVPTVLKSDRSVFDKMLPIDDNEFSIFDEISYNLAKIQRSQALAKLGSTNYQNISNACICSRLRLGRARIERLVSDRQPDLNI